ncbi:MAG: hypothetical protein AAFY72_11960 [Cyanobacteria bacterium J06649_4]
MCERKAELDNLLIQKESREINRDAEVARLKSAEEKVQAASERIDNAYQSVLMSA